MHWLQSTPPPTSTMSCVRSKAEHSVRHLNNFTELTHTQLRVKKPGKKASLRFYVRGGPRSIPGTFQQELGRDKVSFIVSSIL